MSYTGSMNWSGSENYDEWVWRHTAQNEDFATWYQKRKAAQEEAEAERLKAQRINRYSAHIAAWQNHKAYGHLPKRDVVPFDIALKIIEEKFGRKPEEATSES